MVIFEGGCHCGNLSYVFEATRPLAELGLRACMCSFCRTHGARNTSDPDGRMRIEARDASKLQRYRFGLRTADFLICAECGVYIGALIQDRFTVNVNTFRDKPPLDAALMPNDYGAEDTSGRVERRMRKWTPVVELKL